MKTAPLATLTALLALLATSAFGDEYFGVPETYGAVDSGWQDTGFVDSGSAGYAPAAYGNGYGGSPHYAGDGLPGGYENRVGSPYFYTGGDPAVGYGGNVYTNHFGLGFHRSRQSGSYVFPYYSYRRPWYHPGPPVYNANTNLPW